MLSSASQISRSFYASVLVTCNCLAMLLQSGNVSGFATLKPGAPDASKVLLFALLTILFHVPTHFGFSLRLALPEGAQ